MSDELQLNKKLRFFYSFALIVHEHSYEGIGRVDRNKILIKSGGTRERSNAWCDSQIQYQVPNQRGFRNYNQFACRG